MDRAYSTNAGEKECIYIIRGKARRKDHQEVQDIGGPLKFKRILGRQNGKFWAGLVWLRIGTSGGLL
jgi:hypothetical protein